MKEQVEATIQILKANGQFKSYTKTFFDDYETNLANMAKWACDLHIKENGQYAYCKCMRNGKEDKSYSFSIMWKAEEAK